MQYQSILHKPQCILEQPVELFSAQVYAYSKWRLGDFSIQTLEAFASKNPTKQTSDVTCNGTVYKVWSYFRDLFVSKVMFRQFSWDIIFQEDVTLPG